MEQLVHEGVLELDHVLAITFEHELSCRWVPYGIVTVTFCKAGQVDADHVAKLCAVVACDGVAPNICEPIGRYVCVFGHAIIVACNVVHVQTDFLANEPLVCSGSERREAVEQQLDSLWFELVHHAINKELEIFVAECIAS